MILGLWFVTLQLSIVEEVDLVFAKSSDRFETRAEIQSSHGTHLDLDSIKIWWVEILFWTGDLIELLTALMAESPRRLVTKIWAMYAVKVDDEKKTVVTEDIEGSVPMGWIAASFQRLVVRMSRA